MALRIKSLEYYLPEKIETNEFLQKQNPNWDLKSVTKKSGVSQRHIAGPDETAYDLSLIASNLIFKNYDKTKIDGIIFCTQSPDYIMPSNSFLLHKDLELKNSVFAYDFNHACTGYIYALAMANSFIKSNMADTILLVNADTYSKYINKKDRSTRVLFGDGAAATIVEKTIASGDIIDIELASNGNGYDKFWIPSGGLRQPKSKDTRVENKDILGNVRSSENIAMDGLGYGHLLIQLYPNK